MESAFILIAAGAAVGGFAQGVSGFAFALAALSIWAWGIGPAQSAVLAVFGSLVGQLVTLPFVWRGLDWRRALPFVLGGLLGIPIGAQLIGLLDANLFRFGLGLFLLIYCPAMLLLSPELRITFGGRIGDAIAGWIGGILGGLSGLSGPVPTLWTTLRGWDKDAQRGVLQSFNIAMHAATLTVYALSGRIIEDMAGGMAVVALTLIPFALLGIAVFRRLSTTGFRRLVLMLLCVSGLALVWGAVTAWT